MKIIETKDYTELSLTACAVMESMIAEKPDCVIVLATGDSPVGAYKFFTENIKSKGTDVSRVRFVKLDEWLGLPHNHISTCENFLDTHIISPLNIDGSNYISFNSETADSAGECKRIEEWLVQNGPVDLCVLGLGVNGHLGLNEPSDRFLPFCHTVAISEETSKHQMLSKTDTVITKAVTLGMADILSSGKILFLVTGEAKSEALNRFMSAEVTPECPCSALWLHRNVTCLINKSDYL